MYENGDTNYIIKQWFDAKGNQLKYTSYRKGTGSKVSRWHILNQAYKDSIVYEIIANNGKSTSYFKYNKDGRVKKRIRIRRYDYKSKQKNTTHYYYEYRKDSSRLFIYESSYNDKDEDVDCIEEYTKGGVLKSKKEEFGYKSSRRILYDTIRNRISYSEYWAICKHGVYPDRQSVKKYHYNALNRLVRIMEEEDNCGFHPVNRKTTYKYNWRGKLRFEKSEYYKNEKWIKYRWTYYKYHKEPLDWGTPPIFENVFEK